MKRISILWLCLFLAFGIGQSAIAQSTLNQELDAEHARTSAVASVQNHDIMEAETGFHRALILAGQERVKKGEMRRVDLVRLRVAMISPAFRDAAEDLAIIQMSASGSDNDIPLGADGQVDWDSLLAFLEKLIPLIIKLIGIFGGGV